MDYTEKDIENFLIEDSAYLEEELGLVAIQQQYRTEYGVIDILAYDYTEHALAVIELKKGVVDESAIGQILRYMVCMKDLIDYFKTVDVHQAYKNVTGVYGILIGEDATDAVKSITRQFDFIRFIQHDVRIEIDFEEPSYYRREESLQKDLDIAEKHMFEKLKNLWEEEKHLEEPARKIKEDSDGGIPTDTH